MSIRAAAVGPCARRPRNECLRAPTPTTAAAVGASAWAAGARAGVARATQKSNVNFDICKICVSCNQVHQIQKAHHFQGSNDGAVDAICSRTFERRRETRRRAGRVGAGRAGTTWQLGKSQVDAAPQGPRPLVSVSHDIDPTSNFKLEGLCLPQLH
jgi:hypothetical protein